MLILTKGNTDQCYVTPLEKSSLNFVNYKVIFTNRTTQDIVEFWFADISTTRRYQKFLIDVDNYFNNLDEGFWTYQIYGVITLGGTPNSPLLESGLMYLKPSTIYQPTKYEQQDASFKTYNG